MLWDHRWACPDCDVSLTACIPSAAHSTHVQAIYPAMVKTCPFSTQNHILKATFSFPETISSQKKKVMLQNGIQTILHSLVDFSALHVFLFACPSSQLMPHVLSSLASLHLFLVKCSLPLHLYWIKNIRVSVITRPMLHRDLVHCDNPENICSCPTVLDKDHYFQLPCKSTRDLRLFWHLNHCLLSTRSNDVQFISKADPSAAFSSDILMPTSPHRVDEGCHGIYMKQKPVILCSHTYRPGSLSRVLKMA